MPVAQSAATLTEELAAVLADEMRHFRQLLDLLGREQAALRAADAQAVLAVLREQEGALARIRTLEQQRTRLLAGLAAPFGLDASALTISRLNEVVPSAASVLSAVSNELRPLLVEVKALNDRNGVLASRGLGFLDRLIAHLTSAMAPERARGYGAQGRPPGSEGSLGLLDYRA